MKTELIAETNVYRRLFAPHSRDDTAVAVQVGGNTLTRGQLREQIERLAGELRRVGIERGDRVVLLLGNTPEYVIAFFALASMSAIAVAVDCRMGTERRRLIMEETKPKLCLYGDACGEPPDESESPVELRYCFSREQLRVGETWLTQPPQRSLLDTGGGSDPVLILFSAGSTGHPKGVVLRHHNLLHIARTVSSEIRMSTGHRDLILSPLTHSGGWQRVTGTFLNHGTIIFPQSLFSVPTLLDEIETHQAEGFFTTPPFIRMLLATPPDRFAHRVPTLKSIEIASAPLTADELGRLQSLLPHVDVYFQYGSTECSRAFILDSRRYQDRLHTVGRPTPGVEIKLMDERGRAVDGDRSGEVWLRGPQLTSGYWERPELNAERFVDGWLRTGDQGRFDADGFLILMGRIDDMINCGGHSYFPAEVEIELADLDGVSSYLVCGVPDPAGVMNQVPWLFAVAEAEGSTTPAELMSYARVRLPSHMVPRQVVMVDQIPLTESGKPSRRRTIELYGPRQEG